jgi:hypothetical protein
VVETSIAIFVLAPGACITPSMLTNSEAISSLL